MKKLISILAQYRNFLTSLALLGVLGYTIYAVSQIANIQPDQAVIDAKKKELQGSRIKFDRATIDQLNAQLIVPSEPNLGNLGKSDPFSP